MFALPHHTTSCFLCYIKVAIQHFVNCHDVPHILTVEQFMLWQCSNDIAHWQICCCSALAMPPKAVAVKAEDPQAEPEVPPVRSSREFALDTAVSIVLHYGTHVLDTVTRDARQVQLVTDCTLFHQQVIPCQSTAEEIIFDDDGYGGIVMDDGSVPMLEQWLTKQLFKFDDGKMFVKDAAEAVRQQGLVSWTSQLQTYVKKDVSLVSLEVYLLHVRRGAGCAVLWRGSCFSQPWMCKAMEQRAASGCMTGGGLWRLQWQCLGMVTTCSSQ